LVLPSGEGVRVRISLARGRKIDHMFEGDGSRGVAAAQQRFSVAPGPALAVAVAEADPADLSGAELVEYLRACERLAGWTCSRKLGAIWELGCRRPGVDGPGGVADREPGLVSEYAEDEIAVALRIDRRAAGADLDLAYSLQRLPGTASALSAGALNPRKTQVLVDGVRALADDAAAAVEDRVLPVAAEQTPAQLRRSVERAVLCVDPPAAEQRHADARATRRVTLTPAADGMAELWALLPAADAQAVYLALTALAKKGPAGEPQHPATTNTATDTAAPAADTADAADARTLDQRRADALAALGHDILARPGLPRSGRARPSVHITIPGCVLNGCQQHLAHLRGHGPVTGGTARDLATDGIWRRLLTDPASGTLLDLGRSTYVPSQALADHVRTRDDRCRFPGCGQPATRCDLDHTLAWDDGGHTTASNLGALCRHHHRLKTHATWQVHQDHNATYQWTSPTGHTYTTTPTGPPGRTTPIGAAPVVECDGDLDAKPPPSSR
jgi:hypothetical protein